jgi:hypothetical protein
LLSQINNDLSTVCLNRAIWTTMAQTVDGNPTIPRTTDRQQLRHTQAVARGAAR